MKIWIDLDNSPHVPLFIPIIEELEKQGIDTCITARDYAQTIDLLKLHNIKHVPIGKHGGKSKIKKLLNLVFRSFQLFFFIYNKHIDLAVSHGSRTQLIASWLLRIKSILMLDYEYTENKIFGLFASKILMPAIIPEKRLVNAGIKIKKLIRYNGFKEEIYLNNFEPNSALRKELNIEEKKILITIRPSALLGNYHNPLSEKLLIQIIEHCLDSKDTHVLIVSRTKEDKLMISEKFGNKVTFLEKAVNGLELIWISDIFISGGGTMNREAALLNVPTYSVFMGGRPYLDEHLAKKQKLMFIDKEEKVNNIKIEKRTIIYEKPELNQNLKFEIINQLKEYGGQNIIKKDK